MMSDSNKDKKSLQTKDQNKSPLPPNRDREQFEENIDDAHLAVTHEVEKLLTSNKDLVDTISTKLETKLEPVAKDFLEKNSHKIEEYQENPEVLLQDIKEQSSIFKYVDWILWAIEGTFIATSIFSLAASIFSGGTAAPAAIAAETVKWSARKAIRSYIKKHGERLIAKILHKQVIKLLKSRAGTVLGNVAKHFLKSAAYNATLIAVLNLLLTALEDIGLSAVKNILADKGVSDLHLPQDLVADLIKVQEPSAFKRIVGSYIEKTQSDLARLFTTQAGFNKLVFGAALSRLWELKAMKLPKQKLDRIRGKLSEAAKDPKYKKSPTSEQQKKLKEKELSLPKENILKKLSKSYIPLALIPYYITNIQEFLKNKKKQEAEKILENKISAAEILMTETQDELREIEVLNFIKENQSKLSKQQINKLMADVTEAQFANIDILMDQAETANLNQLIETMKRDKLLGVDQQVKTLCLNNSDPKLKERILKELAGARQVKGYKDELARKMSFESTKLQRADLNQKLRIFAEKLMKNDKR
jgi:hypothetical protein